ncbi:MAG: hypothetical protein H6825_09505 [Planctomycetes bacterium]|nr:hypothetical protein [Planctomycetota bacterium]
MIGPLRRRHRRVTGALAVLVPLGFLAGLAGRNPPPPSPVPPALRGDVRPERPADLRTTLDFATLPVSAELWFGADATLRLRPGDDPRRPDVLVLWTPGDGAGDALPSDALLLGSLDGTAPRAFRLPAPAARGGGTLLLDALAHGELFDRAPLPRGDVP